MNRPVRARLRRALPPETFAPRPLRALLVPAWFSAAVAIGAAIVFAGLPWWVDVPLALLLGQCFASMGFAAHEVLHGATVRNRTLQDVLGFVGFLPFVVSPVLWREWHNRQHHGHANQGEADPDSFGDVVHYRPGGVRAPIHFLLPGSGSFISSFFLLYWFTTHNIVVLLGLSKRFEGFDRRPAFRQTGLGIGIWAVIAAVAVFFAGWEVLLITFLAMFVGNALVMGYISTNHLMRPELDHDEPVDNSMSLNVPGFVDVLHGWFSHHVEHHLFPSMSPSQAPKVRAWLQAEVPHRYVSPAWYKALWWLYRTPRPHQDSNTLVHPDDPNKRVDLVKLTEELRDDRWERLAPNPKPKPSRDQAA